jgi:ATP-dependent RNA helicase RhlE
MSPFETLVDHKSLLKSLNDLKFTQPTTIQHKAFSVIMSGKDVVGIAQTGTGKTFAYLLPILKQWKFDKEKLPQILIMVPTRELVMQVVEQVEKLATYMNLDVIGIYGGANINLQKKAVIAGADVIVATPGRLLDLALDGSMKLRTIKKLVIDEVDEMLNLGFRAQLTRVLDLLPLKRQSLMFSATITDEVEVFIAKHFISPVKIEAAPTGTPLTNIVQRGYKVPNFNTKVNFIEYLLNSNDDLKKVLIFTASKSIADSLFTRMIQKWPKKIGVIHSDKTQPNRFDTVKQFQNGNYRILIASDIVARGLDIAEVSHVINFDAPDVPENYMHRIGRTGRADKKGDAIVFITKQDAESIEKIEALMAKKIPMKKLPEAVVISDVLIEAEIPVVKMKNELVKVKKKEDVGPAFHEKSLKNQKVNNKVRRGDAQKLKYGKSKTKRGKKLR